MEHHLESGSDGPDDYEADPWGERTPELVATVPPVLVFDARLDGADEHIDSRL